MKFAPRSVWLIVAHMLVLHRVFRAPSLLTRTRNLAQAFERARSSTTMPSGRSKTRLRTSWRGTSALWRCPPSPSPDPSSTLDLTHGGKFFYEQADADTLLTQALVGFQYRMAEMVGAYATVDIKDRTERVSLRDYNRGAIGGGLDLYFGDFSARLGGSARYFAFKPAPESSSSSVEGSGTPQVRHPP